MLHDEPHGRWFQDLSAYEQVPYVLEDTGCFSGEQVEQLRSKEHGRDMLFLDACSEL
jgi:hypothetical protein